MLHGTLNLPISLHLYRTTPLYVSGGLLTRPGSPRRHQRKCHTALFTMAFPERETVPLGLTGTLRTPAAQPDKVTERTRLSLSSDLRTSVYSLMMSVCEIQRKGDKQRGSVGMPLKMQKRATCNEPGSTNTGTADRLHPRLPRDDIRSFFALT